MKNVFRRFFNIFNMRKELVSIVVYGGDHRLDTLYAMHNLMGILERNGIRINHYEMSRGTPCFYTKFCHVKFLSSIHLLDNISCDRAFGFTDDDRLKMEKNQPCLRCNDTVFEYILETHGK